MINKICIVTGSRAEYDLLYWIISNVNDDPVLELQLLVTGTHLSPGFGYTVSEIENDGFAISKKVEMILSADTSSGITKSTGLGMIGFADAFAELNPDIIILLGDRYEILAAAFSAVVARIPIAHIHGGETTTGAFDEAIRHSITKMSYLHFVAAEEYKKRVIQLGEEPDRVFLVGGLGVDGVIKADLLSKKELEDDLGFLIASKTLLITFHPVTLDNRGPRDQLNELLAALETMDDTKFIFTAPNSDTGNSVIYNGINEFVSKNPDNSILFDSMGRKRYLSCLQFVDAVVGNSSSGLLECPTFNIGTINIGDRQDGRLKADSVIDCEPIQESILKAFKRLYSTDFQKNLKNVKNPYGNGGASNKVVEILKKEQLPKEIKKQFYNL